MEQRIYKAKYLAPTEHKGSRIKVVNLDNLETKMIPYNYQFNNAKDIALYYINSKTEYLVYDTFWDNDTSYVYLLTKHKTR